MLVQLYAENCIHLLSSLTGDASQFHAVTKKRDLNIVRTFRQYFHFLSWHLWVLVFCIKAWYQVYYFSVQYVAGNVFKFQQNNAEFIDLFCITYILGKFQPNFWELRVMANGNCRVFWFCGSSVTYYCNSVLQSSEVSNRTLTDPGSPHLPQVSSHHSPCPQSHNLSVTPSTLKPISSINQFFYNLSGSTWAYFMDFGVGLDLGLFVLVSSFFVFGLSVYTL